MLWLPCSSYLPVFSDTTCLSLSSPPPGFLEGKVTPNLGFCPCPHIKPLWSSPWLARGSPLYVHGAHWSLRLGDCVHWYPQLHELSKFTQSWVNSSMRTPCLEFTLCPALELSCKRIFCVELFPCHPPVGLSRSSHGKTVFGGSLWNSPRKPSFCADFLAYMTSIIVSKWFFFSCLV